MGQTLLNLLCFLLSVVLGKSQVSVNVTAHTRQPYQSLARPPQKVTQLGCMCRWLSLLFANLLPSGGGFQNPGLWVTSTVPRRVVSRERPA